MALDRKQTRRAEAAASRMGRTRVGGPTTVDAGVGEVVVLPIERGEGFPVVHGWLSHGLTEGEFSMLSYDRQALVAHRDPAGTRPLYVAKSGSWVSSDHRFFPGEEAALLPPGSAYDVSSGRVWREEARSEGFQGTFEEACARLAGLIDSAVKERVAGKERVAVAFSGGLDSSVLAWCARKRCKVVACAVHSRGSRDSRAARAAAESIGVELLEQEVDDRAVRRELSELELPFEASQMDRALWCIYSVASREAAQAGAEVILLGQLADELFGGYAKYERGLVDGGSQRAASMMERDLDGCGTRGFVRDEAACCRWLEPRFPFADRLVFEFGRGIPVNFKIRQGVRKAVLREAAGLLGLPVELSRAPKKAAQYSSGVQKLLE